jgi:hypothetical protein
MRGCKWSTENSLKNISPRSFELISHGTLFFSFTTKQYQLAYQPQKSSAEQHHTLKFEKDLWLCQKIKLL